MSIRSIGQKLGPVTTVECLRLRCRECEDTGCWIWLGGCNSAGDGRLYVDRRLLSVQRAAAVLSGRVPKDGHLAFNTCQTHNCGNPEHVVVGTAAAKGKQRSKNGNMKGPHRSAAIRRAWNVRGRALTPEQVTEIRESDEPLRVFVAKFGVAKSTVAKARACHATVGVSGSSVFSWRPA